MWLRSLYDPFSMRGVRLPWPFPVATQVSTYHGNLTFSTNAAGFARIVMATHKGSIGSINVFNDATHTEINAGPATALYDPFASVTGPRRVVNAGLKCRSTASLTNEAGYIQAYASLDTNAGNYDLYRDVPHQHIYTKGEVAHVRWLPSDYSDFDMATLSQHFSHIGFMIVGASSQNYFLQYSITIEYSSTSQTDVIPKMVNSGGNVNSVLPEMMGCNSAKPDSWHESLRKSARGVKETVFNVVDTALNVAKTASAIKYGSGRLFGASGPRNSALKY